MLPLINPGVGLNINTSYTIGKSDHYIFSSASKNSPLLNVGSNMT